MKPYFETENGKLYHGKSEIILPTLPDNSMDSIVTDPPYGLKFMGKKWDYKIPSVEVWRECLRVLKPGGFLLSFAGTRTQHRMACNIEDAGFEIRDMIAWVYSQGFPKSLDVGKAVDKLQGNEREDLGESINNRDRSKHEYNSVGNVGSNAKITKGNSPYEGYGTALKPAWENIGIYQKPIDILGYCAIMIENLNKEIQSCKQNVKNVEKNLKHSQVVSNEEKTNTVQEPVAIQPGVCLEKRTRIGAVEDTNLKAVMSESIQDTAPIDLNTLLLWKNILVDVYEKAKTSTTLTVFETIIDWKILSYYLSLIIPSATAKVKLNQNGPNVSVLHVAEYLNASFAYLNSTLTLSALEPVMSNRATERIKPALEPITVARKPFPGTVAANVLEWGTGGINIDASRIMTEGQQHDVDVYRHLSSLYALCCKEPCSVLLYRDLLTCIFSGLRSCNRGGKTLLHNEADLGGRLHSDVVCGFLLKTLYPNGVWCGLSQNEFQDFRYDCPACSRLYDAHIQRLIKAAQDSPALLADVLVNIDCSQYEHKHNQSCQYSDHLSNLDDFRLSFCFSFLLKLYTTQYNHSTQESQGRFPANLIHDGSPEVLALFPESKGSGSSKDVVDSVNSKTSTFGSNTKRNVTRMSDAGSAARFFKSIPIENICSLCCLTLDQKHNTMSKTKENVLCKNTHAQIAENYSLSTQATKECTAQENAMLNQNEKNVRFVKYAGNLCDSCAIDIVQNLVAISEARKGAQSQLESQAIQGFITGYKKCTLLQNLARYVENLDSIDTTQTTTSLLKLFGCVRPAIKSYIQKIKKSEPKRFAYIPKASKRDRGRGNNHPTVKPVDLIRYLCRLVTPPGGAVLDPFFGSGTMGKAAILERFRFIGIEQGLKNCETAVKRIKNYWQTDYGSEELKGSKLKGLKL